MNIFKKSGLLLVAALFAAPALSACSADESRTSAPDVGSLGLRLQVNGRQIDVVHYEITRAGATVLAGDLNVASAHSLSFRIGGLAAGGDYAITLTAVTVDGVQTCSGNANFAVLAGRTTAVSVVLNCSDLNPTNGSIDVNGELNQCPALAAVSVFPLEAMVGESISLSANGTDGDDTVLTYTWSEGGATFATSAAASYVCAAAGDHELSVMVADDSCSAGDSVTVHCSEEVVVCGDGIVEGMEQCDDGNVAVGDGCDDLCRTEACGNGRVDAGETCDDRNTVSGDGCSATCQHEVLCGDGVVEGDETCDDGNTVAGDGCSEVCLIEAVCGNGVVEGDEVCDDGNTVDGDTCSADCRTNT